MPSGTGSHRNMSRMFLVALYFGAEVLDHSLGYLWQANLPGANETSEDETFRHGNATSDDTVSGAEFDNGYRHNDTHQDGTAWTFGWWRIRGTAEYIFGKKGTIPDGRGPDDDGYWFSTPEGTGRMGRDAGWIGYFIDSAGVAAFGSWWAYAAWIGIGIGATILLGLLAYSLQTLLAPVRWVTTMLSYAWGSISCCCTRRGGGEPVPLPEGPPLARSVEWRGPATGWPAETRYLQEKVKGRGSRRRLNDVLVRVRGQVARLQQDESSQRRIDTHGLKVKFLSITGCTSRQFRRELEEIGEIHLCRQVECGVEHGMHVKEYAGIDREALLDLHQYANGSPRWLIGVLCRCFCRWLPAVHLLLWEWQASEASP